MALAGNDIDSTLHKAVQSIINKALSLPSGENFSFSKNQKLDAETNEILRSFSDSVIADITTRSIRASEIAANYSDDEYSYEDHIRKYLNDSDAREKTDKYSKDLKNQLELYIAYAITAGWNASKTTYEYMLWKNHPYRSTFILSDKNIHITASRRSPGSGNYTGVASNLKRMEQYLIFSVYNFTNRLIWRKDKDIVGYRTFRNSSYPCEICDSLLGKVHALTEIAVPAHGHCVCGSYPVFREDMEDSK